jgi:nucleotide-binding universal stress UspA family protein
MNTIVVGYDNSAAAQTALEWAAEHAARNDGELLVMYVASSIAEWELAAAQINPDPIRHEFERRLNEEWTAGLRKAHVPYRTKFTIGRVADELMRAAREEEATLIVIGMTARGTLSELVLGSTRHELMHHAVRPVIAVPASWNHPPVPPIHDGPAES